MDLLPTSFASAVASSKDSIKNISKIISKYCGQEKAEFFLDSCNNLDFSTANNILEDTVKKITGYDSCSISMALSLFAEKFPNISKELEEKMSSASFESDKIKVIESYRKQIINIIDGKIR